VTHVYASTERGDICAVSDGMEGLPREKLGDHELTGDGELVMDGHATGDLWESRGSRLIFAGRREEIINVGGAKVAPGLVEAACMGIAQVLECRAYAVKSALLGEVVGLDYVGGIEPKELRSLLVSAVPKFAVPARITRMDAIPVTSAGKTLRRAVK
jgi:acyl-coenzyme A synthetase/AMP-(fatty) acid ligase